jgi:uncharacterized protein YpmB
MFGIITIVVLIVAIAVGGILVYKKNPAKVDAALNAAEAAAAKAKADAAAIAKKL